MFTAIVGTITAVLLPYLCWHSYTTVSTYYDHGAEGVLSVSRVVQDNHAQDHHTYDAELAGKAIRICMCEEELEVDAQYLVRYLPHKLREYSGAPAHFRSLVFVGDAHSKWECFITNFGSPPLLVGTAIMEMVAVGTSCTSWYRLIRAEIKPTGKDDTR